VTVAARKRAGAARAQATRERVVAAAAPLFVARGYLDTTMAELAAAAGVAVQTLYLTFGGKAAVLQAVWAAATPDRPAGWAEALTAASNGPAALGRHVEVTTALVERRHPLDAVLRAAAADPEPAELLATARAATLDAHARAVDELAEHPGFTVDMSLQRATDVVVTLLAPETYGLLVVQQGWTTPDWAEWALRHLVADLFPGWNGVAAG
jgi:AcrR family transcriptional regulator